MWEGVCPINHKLLLLVLTFFLQRSLICGEQRKNENRKEQSSGCIVNIKIFKDLHEVSTGPSLMDLQLSYSDTDPIVLFPQPIEYEL